MALVLVVEDESAIREVLELLLNQLGHRVLQCADAKHAMALIDEEPVDVVITDILMPEVDGIELLRTLKYSRPEMPVVVMSGGGQYDVRLLLKTADLLGAVVTLAKPFTAPDVARAVDLALRRPDQAGRGDA